jgi:hypothetical protein
MAEFFINPWVVGIGASLISGLIVAILTRQIFTRKVDREYMQCVSRANNEILSAAIPLIAEQKPPESILVESLIRSTRRKYDVSSDALYTPKSLAEEVIKEIVSTSFLSTQQKTEFCSQVAGMIPAPSTQDSCIPTASDTSQSYQASWKRTTTMMSFYIAAMASFASLLSVATYFLSKSNTDSVNITKVALPIMASTVIFATLLSLLSLFAQRLKLSSIELKAGGVRADFRLLPENDDEETENTESNKAIDGD